MPATGLPDSHLQKLCVFLQLKTSRDRPVHEQNLNLTSKKAFSLENTMIIYDSLQGNYSRKELIPGDEDWKQFSEESTQASPGGIPVEFAAVQLIVDAVVVKWSEYIFFMHTYISTLEEDIYEQPANDKQAPNLWGMSKHVLQAERLITSHILLWENVQSGLTNFGGRKLDINWLSISLEEFKRLRTEVEDSLRKPVAHMVDLVSCHRFIVVMAKSHPWVLDVQIDQHPRRSTIP